MTFPKDYRNAFLTAWAKYLLQKETSIETLNSMLKESCTNRAIDMTKLVLEAGADPMSFDSYALIYVCIDGNFEIAKLLLDAGADPTARDNQSIKYASSNGHVKVVKLLLEKGAEPVEYAIENAWTNEIRDLLIQEKYKVDGKEYHQRANQMNSE